MAKPTDIRPIGAELYFLPVETRVPLRFGPETLTRVTCARARVMVEDRAGRRAEGWGETPLSVQWVWPSTTPYSDRLDAVETLCRGITIEMQRGVAGHPLEVSLAFQRGALRRILRRVNYRRGASEFAAVASIARSLDRLRSGELGDESEPSSEPVPWLAALVCFSPFDLALHDAFGKLVERPTFETFTPEFLNHDLSAWLKRARGSRVSFAGRYPGEFLRSIRLNTLPAWHLVGGLDPLDASDLTGNEPKDGHPVFLADWIRTDGLKCLKMKLRGNDAGWDFNRIARVGAIAEANGVDWLSVDFNCTVHDPAYVNAVLDRLRAGHPRMFERVLYVEQPFPYDLEAHQLDVHSVSERKPLFLDESAHDWSLVKLGRELGWTGVALKTCKTLTGAVLTACWAKAHGMSLMVQDLTNPMLAQIPHLLLAAHVETIMGVETNSMQFYPEASRPEAAVHPGLYRRRNGCVDLSSICGPGLGYRLEEIRRELPRREVWSGAFWTPSQ